ncbi:hypothetical protein HGA11_18210 [Mycolicibacterium septicum DSM 44393]|uniref:Uncharacterized protein n=1 Tax=Mycolicibacterium septicum DSM 44393 TaxID=1341646 RepID=A0A7X6RWZ7_9MYCO|nr:hypothetical protein [Mycolicibacterium septicum]NKZ12908.1 hypothetical protein [Mycolicibacterium septicum DSM 44393]
MTGEKRRAAALCLLAAILLFTTGCGPGANRPGTQVSPDTAAQFGDVVVPPGVEVLAVDSDSGIDTRYRLALRTTAAHLPALVSQFTDRPQPSQIPRTTPVIAGPELSTAPNPLYAQDRVTTKAGRTVYREIVVDERSPDEVYVHLAMYTT